MIVGRTLEHQMLDRLVGAVAVWTDGRVPAPDTVEVSCYQCLVWLVGAVVCLHAAPQIHLFASAGNGWPYLPRYRQLMRVS